MSQLRQDSFRSDDAIATRFKSSVRSTFGRIRKSGFSLIEVVLATAILTVLVVATYAYVSQPSDRVKSQACELHKQRLQVLVQQYYFDYQRWPSRNMRQLVDQRYLGEQIPRCPVDGRRYLLNRRTGLLIDHSHP